jgi:hypothetical protein
VQPRNAVWVALGIFALALGVMVGAFARTESVRAQAPEPEFVSCEADFPVLGIERDEDARVHAAWVGGEGGDGIDVKVLFIDRTGNVFQSSDHALAPGETVSVALDLNQFPNNAPRLDFRAVLLLVPPSGMPGFPADKGCPAVITNLERLSRKGTLVLPPVARVPERPCRTCPPPSPRPVDVPPPPDVQPFPDVPPPPDAHPDLPPPVDVRPPDMPPPVVDMPPPADMPPPPPPTDFSSFRRR